MTEPRDRDADHRPRNARPRDGLGRPLAHGADGVARAPEGVVRTPDETLREGGQLLADGLPFHAHEVFEDAWKSSTDDDRELWRGLAQLGVGITHAARGNRRGAVTLLRRAGVTIASYRYRAAHGLDVVALGEWIDDAVTRVEAQCPIRLGSPPLR